MRRDMSARMVGHGCMAQADGRHIRGMNKREVCWRWPGCARCRCAPWRSFVFSASSEARSAEGRCHGMSRFFQRAAR